MVGGSYFFSIPGVDHTSGIARWTGTSWKALGRGLSGSGQVRSIDGNGAQVLVGGEFPGTLDSAGNSVANTNSLAFWNTNTETWSSAGTGVDRADIAAVINFTDSVNSPQFEVYGFVQPEMQNATAVYRYENGLWSNEFGFRQWSVSRSNVW